MNMDVKKEMWFLLLFLFGNGVPFVEGNLTNSRQGNNIPNQVYFPALPDINIEEFGLASRGRSDGHFSPHLQPPVVKISHLLLNREPSKTTGTLPLAKKSHVVDNSVTEAPGPSYLTESAYYHTTPAPRIEETGSDEDEGFHVDSRTFLPQMEEKSKKITLVLPENPAYLYYIPTESENLSAESPPPQPIDSIVAEPTPITHNNQPNSTNILSSFHDVETTHKPESTISQLPSSTPPTVNFEQPNALSAQRSHRPSPASSRKPTSFSSSRGYLPKPARNPFAPRFSKQIVKSETPQELVRASVTHPLLDSTAIPINRESTTIASVSLHDTHLERQIQPPKEASPSSSLSRNKERAYSHFLRHFGFNFNNAAVNTIKEKRKAAFINDISKEKRKHSIRPPPTDFFSVPSLFRG